MNSEEVKCMYENGVVVCSEGKQYYVHGEQKNDKVEKWIYYEGIVDYTMQTFKKTDEPISDKNVYYLDGPWTYKILAIDGDRKYYVGFNDYENIETFIKKLFKERSDVQVIHLLHKFNVMGHELEYAKDKYKISFVRTREGPPDINFKLLAKNQEKFLSENYNIIVIREEEIKEEIKEEISVINSTVNKNLQWAANSCWIDSVLVNLFTYKTPLTNNFYSLIINNKDNFNECLYKLLYESNNIHVMDYIKTLHNKCKEKKKEDSETYCKDFTLNSISSNDKFIDLFKKMYYPDMDIINVTFRSPTMFSSAVSTAIQNKKNTILQNGYIILSTQTYHMENDIDTTKRDLPPGFNVKEKTYDIKYHDIINENGKLNDKVKNIEINGNTFTLTSATIGWPGHYGSIVYDKNLKTYIIINKLSDTRVYLPRSKDWQQTTYLFYYPLDKINVWTNAISGGALSYYNKYIKYKNKYNALKNLIE